MLWAKTLYASQKPATLFAAATEAQAAPTVSFDTSPPASATTKP